MSTIKVDTYLTRGGASEIAIDKLKGVTAAGSMLVVGEGGTTTTNLQQGLAKAWLNMNGTGTVATRDSFNIASITDNGAGDYTGTFTNAMNTDDYVCAGEGGTGSGGTSHMILCAHLKATGSARVTNLSDGGGAADRNIHGWMLMGDLA
jgi:hypothetical protein